MDSLLGLGLNSTMNSSALASAALIEKVVVGLVVADALLFAAICLMCTFDLRPLQRRLQGPAPREVVVINARPVQEPPVAKACPT